MTMIDDTVSCALMDNQTVQCWGNGHHGAMGRNGSGLTQSTGWGKPHTYAGL